MAPVGTGRHFDSNQSMKLNSLFAIGVALLALAGCKPKDQVPEITDLQRKEAANLVSEAQFAITLRDYSRAEPLLEKAAKLAPDTGEYWLNLGVIRRKQGNTSGAKSAYEQALSAFRARFKKEPKDSGALLQQVQVLALLGRIDDARDALENGRKKAPDDRMIRQFAEQKQLDEMIKHPTFKEMAL